MALIPFLERIPALPREVFKRFMPRNGEKERGNALLMFTAGGIISARHPDNSCTSPGTVKLLRLLLKSPLNPLHCSAVKSTSSPVDYSPPSAAFITKFMMKQFCVLFLRRSRYRGGTCSRGDRKHTL